MIVKITLIFEILIALSIANDQLKKPFDPKDVDVFVEKLLKCRNIPSATVSVVQLNDADEMVLQYAKGYGKTDPACESNSTCETVDENSKFCIGSISKSFTAGVMGKILYNSKFNETLWDTPLKNLLPSDQRNFVKGDVLAERVTVRDLLAHRMGLEGKMLSLMMGLEFPRTEVWKNLSIMQEDNTISEKFRTSFMYSNWMYGLVGHISELLTNETWEQLVQKYYFDPLNMKSSTFITKEDAASDWSKFAKFGILKNDTKWVSSKWIMDNLRNVDGAAPAGAICSTSEDMKQYLRFLLSNSSDDSVNVPKKIITDTFKPSNYFEDETYIHMPKFPLYSGMHTYGMGFGQGTYREYRTVSHSGGIEGYISELMLLPDSKLGVFVSTTNDPFPQKMFAQIIANHALDLALGKSPFIDIDSACTIYPEALFPASPATDSDVDTKSNFTFKCDGLAEEFKAFEGIYQSPMFGRLYITPNISNGFLEFKMGRSGRGKLCRTIPPVQTLPQALQIYFEGLFENFNVPASNLQHNVTIIFRSPVAAGDTPSAAVGFMEDTVYHWIGHNNSTKI